EPPKCFPAHRARAAPVSLSVPNIPLARRPPVWRPALSTQTHLVERILPPCPRIGKLGLLQPTQHFAATTAWPAARPGCGSAVLDAPRRSVLHLVLPSPRPRRASHLCPVRASYGSRSSWPERQPHQRGACRCLC